MIELTTNKGFLFITEQGSIVDCDLPIVPYISHTVNMHLLEIGQPIYFVKDRVATISDIILKEVK